MGEGGEDHRGGCRSTDGFVASDLTLHQKRPGAFETVAALCREALQKRYGNAAPKEAQARLAYERGCGAGAQGGMV